MFRPCSASQLASLLVLWCITAGTTAASPDPVVGRWAGVAGFPTDRVDIAFEFRREPDGALGAYLYQSVINFYGLNLGTVKRERGQYVIEDLALRLEHRRDRLEGTIGYGAPISLVRTQTLPSEVPLPELPTGPGPRWQVKLGGAIYAPAALRDAVAYVGSTTGLFHAISLADGAFVWSFAAGRPIFGEALATAGRVYFVCDDGYLYALERAHGKQVWRYDLGDQRATRFMPHQVVGDAQFDFDVESPRPLLDDGVLYVGSGDGSLHAVDEATGKRIWRHEGTGKARSNAALDAERVYYGTLGHWLYGVDRRTGRHVWDRDLHSMVTTSPVLIDGRLLDGVRDGMLAAFDPATGKTLWRMGFWGSAVDSEIAPAGDGSFLIGSSDLRRVQRIDARDGGVRWRTDVFGWAWTRPLVDADRVYAATAGADPYEIRHVGGLLALDRETGRILWRWPAPAGSSAWLQGFLASPVASDGVVVIGDLNGTLYGFPTG